MQSTAHGLNIAQSLNLSNLIDKLSTDFDLYKPGFTRKKTMTAFDHQIKIPATYMRGGTSKGVFFNLPDLPLAAQNPGEERDQLLLRVIGSPDPFGKNVDGLGGGLGRSENKIAIISKGTGDHDVSFLFGQVSVNSPKIDWSGNCGNLLSAVGIFALRKSLIDPKKIPSDGKIAIKIWQVNTQKTIISHIPIKDFKAVETGDFKLDGVAFSGSEIRMEYLEPSLSGRPLFPTCNLVDYISVPTSLNYKHNIACSLVNAGIPTVFLSSRDIGVRNEQLQDEFAGNADLKLLIEEIRVAASIKMELVENEEKAREVKYIPAVALVDQPMDYTSSDGRLIAANQHDLKLTLFSMGSLHHAVMGTVAVSTACICNVPGTILELCGIKIGNEVVKIGHPSGIAKVKSNMTKKGNTWFAEKVEFSRSARTLMDGHVYIPS